MKAAKILGYVLIATYVLVSGIYIVSVRNELDDCRHEGISLDRKIDTMLNYGINQRCAVFVTDAKGSQQLTLHQGDTIVIYRTGVLNTKDHETWLSCYLYDDGTLEKALAARLDSAYTGASGSNERRYYAILVGVQPGVYEAWFEDGSIDTHVITPDFNDYSIYNSHYTMARLMKNHLYEGEHDSLLVSHFTTVRTFSSKNAVTVYDVMSYRH